MSLPLRYQTPDAWAVEALSDPLALLSDHAYLERKAASNALELLNRWPAPKYPKDWVTTLSAIARDEAAHLDAVARLIAKRGARLERLHRSSYAGDLRALVRRGNGPLELLDRLLVSALIEARSCERFSLLARAPADAELKAFYRGLHAAEMGHFTIFLRLAGYCSRKANVEARWDELLDAEARIIQAQLPGARIHSAPT